MNAQQVLEAIRKIAGDIEAESLDELGRWSMRERMAIESEAKRVADMAYGGTA